MTKIMTHIVAGYPNMKKCEELATLMDKKGVSFIEIQIPFSDPIADGKTILKANMKSLDNGTTTDDCFALMTRLKKKITTPLLFMTYFNVVFKYGIETFCKKAKEAGCYGLIVPDIPIDEEKHDHYLRTCKKYGLKPIQVISQITPNRRLEKIAKAAKGFVYCVSTTGTTGERKNMNRNLEKYIKNVKKFVKLPVAVGFGISNRSHVEEVGKYAEIAVIGSKILNIYNESKSLTQIEEFLEEIV